MTVYVKSLWHVDYMLYAAFNAIVFSSSQYAYAYDVHMIGPVMRQNFIYQY